MYILIILYFSNFNSIQEVMRYYYLAIYWSIRPKMSFNIMTQQIVYKGLMLIEIAILVCLPVYRATGLLKSTPTLFNRSINCKSIEQ